MFNNSYINPECDAGLHKRQSQATKEHTIVHKVTDNDIIS